MYPQDPSELVVAVVECTESSFTVRTGARTEFYPFFVFGGGFSGDVTDTNAINKYLGFSFVALGQLNNAGIVHGSVERPERDDTGGIKSSGLVNQGVQIPGIPVAAKWNASAFFNDAQVFLEEDGDSNSNPSTPPKTLNASQANETIQGEPAGGVLIEFDTCFDDIPSVIVTPKVKLNDNLEACDPSAGGNDPCVDIQHSGELRVRML